MEEIFLNLLSKLWWKDIFPKVTVENTHLTIKDFKPVANMKPESPLTISTEILLGRRCQTGHELNQALLLPLLNILSNVLKKVSGLRKPPEQLQCSLAFVLHLCGSTLECLKETLHLSCDLMMTMMIESAVYITCRGKPNTKKICNSEAKAI